MRIKGDVIASLLIGGFGAVPVVEDGRKLAGIVSGHDLPAAIDDRHHLDAAAAKDIMMSNPYSVRVETTLGTLVQVLRASDLVRIPVVDGQGQIDRYHLGRDVLQTYLATGANEN